MGKDSSRPMQAALASCQRHFVAAAIFSALLNLLYIAPTLYMLQVYDRVVPTGGLQTLLFLTLALLLAIATLAFLDRVRVRLLVRAGVALNAGLAPALLDATLGRPDAPEARQALRDVDQLRLTLTGPGVLALFDAPWLPVYIVVCFLVHPWIGATALAGGIVLPLIAWGNERATRSRLDEAQQVASGTYAAQEAVMEAADVVRALGMRRALVARQIRQRESMLTAQTAAALAGGSYITATKFVRLMLQSMALGLGAWLAVDGMISAGAIFASSFLIARALAPIEQLVATWRSLIQARGIRHRLDRLLAATAAREAITALPRPKGVLMLEDVSVFNPNRDGAILQSIGIAIAAGEIVAIVGPSGAGKSTLARLIAGAALPDRGVIRLDGADLRDWDPERLAPHIGYLPQAPSLFAGTVAENIARFGGELGGDRAQIDAGIVAATEAVGARHLVQMLPDGFDYRLGPGGRGLSAGQAQRIALARAVHGDPVLLVLDEPNAHLDAEGDAALVVALGRMKTKGQTVLIVSHKLSILPMVDRIMVLNGGRVRHFGSRDDVMARLAAPASPISQVPRG
jgi:ATP-binding cassette subfamily C protein